MNKNDPPEAEPPEPHSHGPRAHTPAANLGLAIAALGVVYGDIGTSPLYAMKECFAKPHGMPTTPENIFGILSLIFWALTLVVVVKYLFFVLRADNHGEGGILALFSLTSASGTSNGEGRKTSRAVLLALGIFGAALLYGDGAITPVVSVFGAIEGLTVATPLFRDYVVPITIGILVALFLIQRRGTAGIGAIFGPAMLLWFLTLIAIGLPWIIQEPSILWAVNPYHAIRFFMNHRLHGFLALGAVVLCITGGEALYADMGHFGKRPIRTAWFALVFPALLINYFGQGALLLHAANTQAIDKIAENPFYSLVSQTFLYPLVAIATLAAVIASQALISGAYSLTRQAIQLGYWPRLNIVHTSGEAEGQIYMPGVNWALLAACIALTLYFKNGTNIAAAYGIAVTGTMAITSILFVTVALHNWHWSKAKAYSLLALFLGVDLAFFLANVAKIKDGGWVPVALAMGLFILMTTWKRGRAVMAKTIQQASLPLDLFLDDLARRQPHRVKGTAVFMTSNPDGAPVVLLHHFKHNKVLHEQVVILAVLTERIPEIPFKERVTVREMGEGFYQVTARYGFMQTPNVPEIMRAARAKDLITKEGDTSYFLGRESLVYSGRTGFSRWRMVIFSFLSRNARSATAFFGLPPNRVVELGAQLEL